MAGMMTIFIKLNEMIKNEMDKGRKYEEAKSYVYNMYKDELKNIKRA